MARPKKFDTNTAVADALEVFWAQGYEATSVQDLVDTLGIERGSLYGAFGSKDHLYHLAFDRYVLEANDTFERCMGAPGSVRERIAAFLHAIVDTSHGRGCFVGNTACERNQTDDVCRERTQTAADGTRSALIAALEGAAAAGEVIATQDVEAVADAILTLMQGVQVMATMSQDRTSAHSTIDFMMARLI